jgi:hypothetical protein
MSLDDGLYTVNLGADDRTGLRDVGRRSHYETKSRSCQTSGDILWGKDSQGDCCIRYKVGWHTPSARPGRPRSVH